MGGIMIPISIREGMREAQADNRADERFDMLKQQHGLEVQGRELGLQRDRLALDEAQKDVPLKQMEREAKMVEQIAKFGAQNLENVIPEKKAEYLAKLFSDMPAHGALEARDGRVFSGETEIPLDTLEAKLVELTDFDAALKLKRDEYAPKQYVVGDKVVTMTPQQAARVPGAQKFDNVKGGLELGQSRAEIDNTRAQAIERRAQAGRHRAEAEWVGPKAQASIAADEALAVERRASAKGKGREGADRERKAIRDEIEFVTRQIKSSGSNTFNFMGDMESLDGLDSGQKQSVAARMAEIGRDPKANAYERQIAGRYVALMQAGGYLDSDEDLAAAEGARAEYANLVRQFGRDRAREIIARRDGNPADPRNR